MIKASNIDDVRLNYYQAPPQESIRNDANNLQSNNSRDLENQFRTMLHENQSKLTYRDEITETFLHKSPNKIINRNLAVGDFKEFNNLLKGAVFRLPDSTVVKNLFGGPITMNIKMLFCRNLSIQDISVTGKRNPGLNSYSFLMSANGLKVDCSLRWDYIHKLRWTSTTGSGTGNIITIDNSISTTVAFNSKNFDSDPPHASSVKNCNMNVKITELDIEGSGLGILGNLFEDFLRGTVADQIEEAACNEISNLDDMLLSSLNMFSNRLLPYMDEIPESKSVSDEGALVIQEDEKLLNFMTNPLVLKGLDEVNKYFTYDVNDSSSEGQGINAFLRSYVLNEERVLSIPGENLPMLTEGGVLFEGHDMLTESKILLGEVRVIGMDTFKSFSPIEIISNHTLATNFEIAQLIFELDLTISIKPSTVSNTVVTTASSTSIIEEKVTIRIGIEELKVTLTLLMAINLAELGKKNLGAFLHSGNILPCLLSSIHTFNVTQLDVSISDISAPTLDGFISVGIGRAISRIAKSIFDMYKGVILRAIPGLIANELPQMIPGMIEKFQNNESCSFLADFGEQILDFREMLSRPTQTFSNGLVPLKLPRYGDLSWRIKEYVDEYLLGSSKPDELPKINEMIIGPITKFLSTKTGSILVSDEISIKLIKLEQIGIDKIELNFTDTFVNNINTIGPPLRLLDIRANDGSVLENEFKIGTPAKQLELETNFIFNIASQFLQFSDEVKMKVALPSAHISLVLLAKIKSQYLMSIPIEGLTNVNCIFSLVTPKSDVEKVTAAILELALSLPSIQMDVECIDCESDMLKVILELVSFFNSMSATEKMLQMSTNFAKDFVIGPSFQKMLDLQLKKSAALCPYHALFEQEFDDGNALSELHFPSSILELLIISVDLALLSTVVIFSSISDSLDSSLQSRSLQNSFNTNSDVNLMSFLAYKDAIESFSKKQLGGELYDEFLGRKDLGINILIRKFIAPQGTLSLSSDNTTTFTLGNLEVSLIDMRVTGIDTFSSFSFEIIGDQTLESNFTLDEINLELDISLSVADSSGGIHDELVTMTIGVSALEVFFSVFIGVDLNQFNLIQLGSLLHTQTMLPCLLSTISGLNFNQFILNPGDIHLPAFEGLSDKSLGNILSEISSEVYEQFGEQILDGMPRVFDRIIRPMVNNYIEVFTANTSNKSKFCRSSTNGEKAVDFRELFFYRPDEPVQRNHYSNLFQKAKGYLDTDLLSILPGKSTEPGMNHLVIQPATMSQSSSAGTYIFKEDLLDIDTGFAVLGFDRVQLRVTGARIDNLDSFGAPLKLLDPLISNPYTIENKFGIGMYDKPLRFSAKLFIAIDTTDETEVWNEVFVTVEIKSVVAALNIMLLMSERSLLTFPLGDITNVHCWLATLSDRSISTGGVKYDYKKLSAMAVEAFSFTFEDIQVDSECIKCSSKYLSQLSFYLKSSEGQNQVVSSFMMLQDFVQDFLNSDEAKFYSDTFLDSSRRQCPHHRLYNLKESTDVTSLKVYSSNANKNIYIAFLVFALLIILCATALFVVKKTFFQEFRSDFQEFGSDCSNSDETNSFVKTDQVSHNMVNNGSILDGSMVASGAIPILFRYSLPIVILGNIGLFLSGHLSLGATVEVLVSVAGQDLVIGDFFEFSMLKSMADMLKAGATSLVVIMILFSGIWPYSKQFITLFLFCAPTTCVSHERRGSILLWLDILGKWSMIDIFILIISLVSFRVSIESAIFLPPDLYSVDILVIPLWGLYANLIAQLLSQITSHFIIFYHRQMLKQEANHYLHEEKDVEGNKQNNIALDAILQEDEHTGTSTDDVTLQEDEHTGTVIDDVTQKICPLSTMVFESCSQNTTTFFKLRRGSNIAFLFCGALTALFFLVGCCVPIFRLEVLGVVGLLSTAGEKGSSVKSISLFNVVQIIHGMIAYMDSFWLKAGLSLLNIVLVGTCFVVPIALTLFLVILWVFSMKKWLQKTIISAIEVLTAWQYMEVYILSIVVASLQLTKVSGFMMNDYCKTFEATFASLVKLGLISHQDAQCFSVIAVIESSIFILIISCITLMIMVKISMGLINEFKMMGCVSCNNGRGIFSISKIFLEPLEDDQKCDIGSTLSDDQLMGFKCEETCNQFEASVHQREISDDGSFEGSYAMSKVSVDGSFQGSYDMSKV